MSGSWLSPEAAKVRLPDDVLAQTFTLANGLRVVLRPNVYPKNRLLCWLELQAGSNIEETSERGLMHLLEHLVFCGTEAYPDQETIRRRLMTPLGISSSADNNAYTDFRSTVYQLEGPFSAEGLKTKGGASPAYSPEVAAAIDACSPSLKSSNVPVLLHLLHQMCFKATFPAASLESEKGSVVSEGLMRNTVDYRVEKLAVNQLHEENNLSSRMPIGSLKCVRQATAEQLRTLYKKWYRPELMTVFVVGPFISEDEFARLTASAASSSSSSSSGADSIAAAAAPSHLLPAEYQQVASLITTIFGGEARGGVAGASGAAGATAAPPTTTTTDDVSDALGLFPQKCSEDQSVHGCLAPGSFHYLDRAALPPFPNRFSSLRHDFSQPPSAPLRIAQSPLLTKFALSLNVKRPLTEHHTLSSKRAFALTVLDIVLATAFDNRLSSIRSLMANPVFTSVSWDDGPAAEEGCAFAGLQVAAEVEKGEDTVMITGGEAASVADGSAPSPSSSPSPSPSPRWYRAITLAFREALRMQRYGCKAKELQLALQTVVKECKDAAARVDSDESADIIEELQEGLYTRSSMPSAVSEYEWIKGFAREITTDTAAERCKLLLSFVVAAVEEAKAAVERFKKESAPAFPSEPSEQLSYQQQQQIFLSGKLFDPSSPCVQKAAADTAATAWTHGVDGLPTAVSALGGGVAAVEGLNMSLFICCPGPIDTLATATTNGPKQRRRNKSRGTSMDIAEGGAGGAGGAAAGQEEEDDDEEDMNEMELDDEDAPASSALFEKLMSKAPPSSRRGRMLRLINDDSEEDDVEEEGDEEEEEDDGSSSDEDGSDSQGMSEDGAAEDENASAGQHRKGGAAVASGSKKASPNPHSSLHPHSHHPHNPALEVEGGASSQHSSAFGRLLLPIEVLAAIAAADKEEDGSELKPPQDISLPDKLVDDAVLAERQKKALQRLSSRARTSSQAPCSCCNSSSPSSSSSAATTETETATEEAFYRPLLVSPASGDAVASPTSMNDVPASLLPAGSSASSSSLAADEAPRHVDSFTGVVTRQLQNGALLTYRGSSYEKHTVAVAVVFRGGKEVEGEAGWAILGVEGGSKQTAGDGSTVELELARYGPRPKGADGKEKAFYPPGCSELAMKTLIASNAGGHSNTTIERLCSLWGISFQASSTGAESLAITCTAITSGAAITSGGKSDEKASGAVPVPSEEDEESVALGRILELIHLFLFSAQTATGSAATGSAASSASGEWDDASYTRVREDKASELVDIASSLEQLTDLALLEDSFGREDASVVVPTPSSVKKRYPKELLQQCLASQLHPCNAQIIVVGDFGGSAVVEKQVARFLGCWQGSEASGVSSAVSPASSSSVATAVSASTTASDLLKAAAESLCSTSSSFQTPLQGENITVVFPLDLEDEEDDEEDAGDKKRAKKNARQAASKRGRKARTGASNKAEVEKSVFPVPAAGAFGLFSPLKAALAPLLPSASASAVAPAPSTASAAAGSSAPAAEEKVDGPVLWFPPLAKSGEGSGWFAPYSGTVQEVAAALSAPLLVPSAPLDRTSSKTRNKNALLAPVLLSGRVLTLPLEKEQRCTLSIACPLSGKYSQSFIHRAASMLAAAKGGVASSIDKEITAALSPFYAGCDQSALPVDAATCVVNRAHPLFSYRAANVWSEVLNNRLYRTLRDTLGAVYAASFSLSNFESKVGGFGHVSATPIPSKLPLVLQSAVKVLVATLSGAWPLSEDEVKEVKGPIVMEVHSNLRTNSYWLRLIQHTHGVHGCQRSLANTLRGMQSFYERVTTEDVQAALTMEWNVMPKPLPLHVTVGVSGPSIHLAKKHKAAKGDKKGPKAASAPVPLALIEAAVREELSLPPGASSSAGAAGGKGKAGAAKRMKTDADNGNGGAGAEDGVEYASQLVALPAVWQEVVEASARIFYGELNAAGGASTGAGVSTDSKK